MFIDPSGLERIVVSGGVYEQEKQNNGKFYYEFIEPAIKQLKNYNGNANGEKVTWIIADAGWTDLDKDNFGRAMDVNFSNYVDIKYISNSNELIDYLNNMNGNDRALDKITNISFFSHGKVDYIPLGYSYSEKNEQFDFTKKQISELNVNAFDDVYAQFYSCNTGTGEYSFAQAWADQVGGKTMAITPKKGYSNTQTVYTKINDGQTVNYRASRFFNGFSLFGSNNLPIAGSNGYFKIFIPLN